jgi:hypothetical protein
MDNRMNPESNPDELRHEPLKGYSAAFRIAMVAATLYLVYVFVTSF